MISCAADLSCPLCWGAGDVIREADATGRLYTWPCPYDCPPGGAIFIRAPRMGGKAAAAPPIIVAAADHAGRTMAHVMVSVGAFASVGEAKRNGWNKPVAPGDYTVGRKKVRVT